MAFRHANLIDGNQPAQPGMTVVLDGERIEWIGEDAGFASQPDHTIYDLHGRSLMPGMVQCHFHSQFGAFGEGVNAPALGLEAAPAYLSMLAAQNAGLAVEAGFARCDWIEQCACNRCQSEGGHLGGLREGPPLSRGFT